MIRRILTIPLVLAWHVEAIVMGRYPAPVMDGIVRAARRMG